MLEFYDSPVTVLIILAKGNHPLGSIWDAAQAAVTRAQQLWCLFDMHGKVTAKI